MQTEEVLVSASEFIKDRLYFVTLRTTDQPRATTCTHYFTIDNVLTYESFFSDFGPLNISMLFEYCKRLNKKLNTTVLRQKRIVHHTTDNRKTRLNSACLIGCYSIIYLQFSPERAFEVLNANSNIPFIEFRDASVGDPYTISLFDCLKGLEKALRYGFFSFDNFNQVLYEYYERVENGDLNWIVPGKFLGFCGPHNKSKVQQGYPLHAPDFYFSYFKRHNVTTIVRLNKKMYDASKFINAGFEHHDLYFVDGSTPTDKILNDFISICEKASGAIAVHCKAGLGRTGTLIGCYLMKHYRFEAKEAIGWIRMCRPGSVIGHQQVWLECKEEQMWREGEAYRRSRNLATPPKHIKGIYSDSDVDDDVPQQVCSILKKVNTMKLNDKDEKSPSEENASPLTQGDKLNQIKAMRRHTRPLAVRPNNERKTFRTRVLPSPVSTPTLLRAGKISPVSITKTQSSTSRVLTNKRTSVSDDMRNEASYLKDKTNIPETADGVNDDKAQRQLHEDEVVIEDEKSNEDGNEPGSLQENAPVNNGGCDDENVASTSQGITKSAGKDWKVSGDTIEILDDEDRGIKILSNVVISLPRPSTSRAGGNVTLPPQVPQVPQGPQVPQVPQGPQGDQSVANVGGINTAVPKANNPRYVKRCPKQYVRKISEAKTTKQRSRKTQTDAVVVFPKQPRGRVLGFRQNAQVGSVNVPEQTNRRVSNTNPGAVAQADLPSNISEESEIIDVDNIPEEGQTHDSGAQGIIKKLPKVLLVPDDLPLIYMYQRSTIDVVNTSNNNPGDDLPRNISQESEIIDLDNYPEQGEANISGSERNINNPPEKLVVPADLPNNIPQEVEIIDVDNYQKQGQTNISGSSPSKGPDNKIPQETKTDNVVNAPKPTKGNVTGKKQKNPKKLLVHDCVESSRMRQDTPKANLDNLPKQTASGVSGTERKNITPSKAPIHKEKGDLVKVPKQNQNPPKEVAVPANLPHNTPNEQNITVVNNNPMQGETNISGSGRTNQNRTTMATFKKATRLVSILKQNQNPRKPLEVPAVPRNIPQGGEVIDVNKHPEQGKTNITGSGSKNENPSKGLLVPDNKIHQGTKTGKVVDLPSQNKRKATETKNTNSPKKLVVPESKNKKPTTMVIHQEPAALVNIPNQNQSPPKQLVTTTELPHNIPQESGINDVDNVPEQRESNISGAEKKTKKPPKVLVVPDELPYIYRHLESKPLRNVSNAPDDRNVHQETETSHADDFQQKKRKSDKGFTEVWLVPADLEFSGEIPENRTPEKADMPKQKKIKITETKGEVACQPLQEPNDGCQENKPEETVETAPEVQQAAEALENIDFPTQDNGNTPEIETTDPAPTPIENEASLAPTVDETEEKPLSDLGPDSKTEYVPENLNNESIDTKEENVIEGKVKEENVIQETVKEEIVIEENVIEENVIEENVIQENVIEENVIQETVIEENVKEEIVIEETVIQENVIQETVKEEIVIEENVIQENIIQETVLEENVKEEIVIEETVIQETVIEVNVKEEIVIEENVIQETVTEENVKEEDTQERPEGSSDN